jgi:ATP-dependent DNA ligase
MRAQLRFDGRRVTVRSRVGRDCTAQFGELRAIADALDDEVLLRRQAGLFRSPEGLPYFERLRSRLRARAGGAVRAARVTPPATLITITAWRPGDRREPDDLLVSRRGDGGQLRYAGGVRFGLSPTDRARLRSVLERLERPRARRARGSAESNRCSRSTSTTTAVLGGPLRDAVLRNVAVADELPASPT